jgi:hypothetical protein
MNIISYRYCGTYHAGEILIKKEIEKGEKEKQKGTEKRREGKRKETITVLQ